MPWIFQMAGCAVLLIGGVLAIWLGIWLFVFMLVAGIAVSVWRRFTVRGRASSPLPGMEIDGNTIEGEYQRVDESPNDH